MAGFWFAAGVLLMQWLEWPVSGGIGWIPIAVAALVLAIRPVRFRLPLGFFLAGAAWAGWHAAAHRADLLPEPLVGVDLRLTCRIEDFPRQGMDHLRLACRSIRAHRVDGEVPVDGIPRRIRLRWYEAGERLRPGEIWAFTVRLKPPEGMRNPAGFDYAAWLFREGFGATGHVRPWPAAQRLGDDAGPIDRFRRELADRIDRIDGLPAAGLLRAVTLGVRDHADPEREGAFRTTGTAHLLAISGLHVGLVSGFLAFLVRGLWRRSASLCRRIPAPRAAAFAGLAGAFAYAALAGFSLPTQRAAVMLAVLHGGVLCGYRLPPGRALSTALLAVLTLDPLATGSPGFWLSFGAVFILWLLAAREAGGVRSTALQSLLQAVRNQWLLALAMVPLTSILFQQVLWLAPLANLVAVPLFGTTILPLALTGVLLLPLTGQGGGLLHLAGWIFEGLAAGLHRLAEIPGAGWLWSPPPGTGAALAFATLLLLLPRGIPGRWLGVFLLLPLFVPASRAPQPGRFEFVLFDVGQGLAGAVRTAQHLLLYDTGWRSRSGFDTGRAVILPWLVREGIRQVDLLVVSHGDLDHRGGARSLHEALPVYRLLTSVPERFDWRYATACREGQRWRWDGVEFRMLAPVGAGSGNDASCVLEVTAANGQRLLLTGDIEQAAERRLMRRYPKLSADVLVVPHHGSRTSSTIEFVRRIHPDHALIPAGRRNRYRLPAAEVVSRYRAVGSRIWISGRQGAVTCRLGVPGPVACAPASSFRRVESPALQDEKDGATSYDGAMPRRQRSRDS